MTATDHGALMDQTYRFQRRIYDVTRKYYLLGRDHLIDGINANPGARVLEVACGTGRNLAKIRQRYPKSELYGFDISQQMLTTARAKLGRDVALAEGDACQFNPQSLFGVTAFDHIVLSYSLSMIPEWQRALTEAKHHLAPGGVLHVVDFGDCGGLPRWFQRALLAWLARFHVSPRETLGSTMTALAQDGGTAHTQHVYRNYAIYGRYTR